MAKCKDCGADAGILLSRCRDCNERRLDQKPSKAVRPGAPITQTQIAQAQKSSQAYFAWAIVFSVCGVLLCLFGVYRMYDYDSIVGGDAYNYLIVTSRGVGWICSSIVLMLFSCVLALFFIAKLIITEFDGKLGLVSHHSKTVEPLEHQSHQPVI